MANSNELGSEILKLCGLDPDTCRRFSIKFDVNEPPEIEGVFYVKCDDPKGVQAIEKKYIVKLEEK